MRAILRRHPALFVFVVCGLCGLVFYLLVYGPHTLDVTNDDWILQGGDLTQHYLGWMFYRESPWTLPLGLTDRMTYPYEVSVSFTDSIPLFAMFFKVLSPVLPGTFQYLGPFACLSYVLVGGLGGMLVYKITGSPPLGALGGGLFLLTPVLMHRTLGHTALGGQWLLLLPMVFWAWQGRWPGLWQRVVFWCGLLVLCAWVHPYFIPMVMVLQLGWAAHLVFWRRDGKPGRRLAGAALCFILSAGAGVLALWLTGAFAGGVAVAGGGFGLYSFNLNGFLNDIEDLSMLWPALGHGPLQGEGYAYLGLGGLLLCGAALLLAVLWFVGRARQAGPGPALAAAGKALPGWAWCALGVCAVSVFLALSPAVMLGERLLFTLPYPGFFAAVMEIFRCTGRFVWPACYLLPLGGIWVVHRLGTKRLLAVLLALCLCLQGVELTRGMQYKHGEANKGARAIFPYESEGWEALARAVDHIVLEDGGEDVEYDFAWYAAAHGLTVNKTGLARVMEEVKGTAPALCAEIVKAGLPADTALVCPADSGWAVGLPLVVEGLYPYVFDGWAVLVAEPLEGLDTVPSAGDGLDGPLDVLNTLPQALYYSEWRDGGIDIGNTGDVRKQSLPLPAGRYSVVFGGEGLLADHCRVHSVWLGGNVQAQVRATENGWILEFTLETAAPDLEFWVENPGQEEMVLREITLTRAG